MSDGTACDFLSWGHSKAVVCRSKPRTQGGVEQQIRVMNFTIYDRAS